MNQEENCEIMDVLKEAVILKKWDLVDDAISYLKDGCRECHFMRYNNDIEDESDV